MAADAQQPYRAVLRRVGYLLIAIGAVSLPSLIYGVIQLIIYYLQADRNVGISIAFDVLAPIFVIIGYLLLRGDIVWARHVMWFAAFLIALFFWGSLTAASLLLYPVSTLLATPVSIDLNSLDLSTLLLVFDLLASIWIYWQLRLPAVVDAYAAAGYSRSPPIGAFVGPAFIFLPLGVLSHLMR